ncbi:hypothetical protein A5747_13555 [Mycobacterium sp. IS-836]|uniref:hypothetical protein n=1 Tax=Mycobacterium sp. IS-836 TaxID=1834160 RepID=UPI00096D3219|nr:hypothetical protein [Mycobacterium sp. IS-836]OMC55412.1 hypothetical protein A5747_13555 [Mycobacterium sp. IS-836]
MFDIFGLVSDTANECLAGTAEWLFPIGDRILDSRSDRGSCPGDLVYVGAGLVRLEYQLYSVMHLDDESLEMRPLTFARTWLVPAVRSVADGFRESVGDAELIVARAGRVLKGSPVLGGGYLDVNGVKLRWLIDYDASVLSHRLLVDVLVGTEQEIRAREH